MNIYAVTITILFAVAVWGWWKYKIATVTLLTYLKDNYTVPTYEELKRYAKKVINEWFKKRLKK